MSWRIDKRLAVCNGGCGAEISSHELMGQNNARSAGWLYVHDGTDEKHYCPNCASVYLSILNKQDRPK